MQIGSEVFHTLKKALHADGHNTNVGDEGGFAPNLKSAEAALEYIVKSIRAAGYKPGKDVFLGLDCASTEYFKGGKYEMEGEGKSLTSDDNAQVPERARRQISARSPSKTAWPRTTGRAGRR